jgi:hypothetical protein
MVLERRTDARTLLRTTLAAPVRPQTYLNVLYLSLAFPLGLAYFVFVTVGVSLGVGLAILVVGVPILLAVVGVSLGVATLERWLAGLLLDVEVSSTNSLDGDSRKDQLIALLKSRSTWTALVYLPTKFFLGVAAFVVGVTSISTGVAMLFVPLYYDDPGLYVGVVTNRPVELHPALYVGWNNLLVGFETVVEVGVWRVTTLPGALVVAGLGLVVCLVALNVLNVLARASGWYTEVMLRGGYDVVGAIRRAI